MSKIHNISIWAKMCVYKLAQAQDDHDNIMRSLAVEAPDVFNRCMKQATSMQRMMLAKKLLEKKLNSIEWDQDPRSATHG